MISTRYLMDEEFYGADFEAKRQQAAVLRRSREILELEPAVIRRGFQEEDPAQINPRLVGLDAPTDAWTPRQLIALAQKLAAKSQPSIYDPDRVERNEHVQR